jgi:hypothetical protein
MDVDPVALTLVRAWEILEPLEIPMAVMGGLSLAVWNHPRFTQDVDLLLAMPEVKKEAVVAQLLAAGFFFKDQGDAPHWIPLKGMELFQLFYEPPETFMDFRLDLLWAKSVYHIGVLQRRVTVMLPIVDRQIAVVSCEDMLILKLLSGRIIDRVDAATLLRRNRERMDDVYLKKWIEAHRLQSQFAEIWDEAFPGEPPAILSGQ